MERTSTAHPKHPLYVRDIRTVYRMFGAYTACISDIHVVVPCIHGMYSAFHTIHMILLRRVEQGQAAMCNKYKSVDL